MPGFDRQFSADLSCRLTTKNQLAQAIVVASHLGLAGRVELLRSVRAGEVALIEIDRTAEAPLGELNRVTTRPIVCLIGDDDYCSSGPSGWKAWPRLGDCWAKYGMIHAAGGDAATYRLAIDLAVLYRKFLLIETGSRAPPHGATVFTHFTRH
jgi:hypothetical protein